MTERPAPQFNPGGFSRATLSYDANHDNFVVHLDGPRPALSHEVADNWLLRVDDRGRVAGIEIHGLRRLLDDKHWRQAFEPALRELAERDTSLREDFHLDESVGQLPLTARLLCYLGGYAVAKYESAEWEDVPLSLRRSSA
ncbi:MAG: DUF2283 domain-containing protein [Dehalococcoidia bacterium]|nr:DUF2283 domain-containing protein [Dehalococcoidia bacterium]